MRILVLEPYYGGSHKYFLDNLVRIVPADFKLFTLPARKWKWRMRLAAPYFAEQLAGTNDTFDRILCSSFVDVAAFRGLAPKWVNQVPILTYFHENQFTYPVQAPDARDVHFGLTNLTTAMASDKIAFNSRHNRETLVAEAERLCAMADDIRFSDLGGGIRTKSVILYPGIDFTEIDRQPVSTPNMSPMILWNHRWEHDKNPVFFFETLYWLAEKGIDFSVAVAGQSFRETPKIFAEARKRLAPHVKHFGHINSRTEYVRLLKSADLVVSTASHEFFGIAVIEAVRAGCRPLLPARLAYPELFPDQYLYDDADFPARLAAELRKPRLSDLEARQLTDLFSWPSLAGEYESWLLN